MMLRDARTCGQPSEWGIKRDYRWLLAYARLRRTQLFLISHNRVETGTHVNKDELRTQ